MFDRMKVVTRLLLGFSLVILSTVVLGIMATRTLGHLEKLTANIFHHPFTVSTSIMELKASVLRNTLNLAHLVESGDPAEVERLARNIIEERKNVDSLLDLVRERFLGRALEVEEVGRTLVAWRAATDETIGLMRAGRRTEANVKWRDRDILMADAVIREVDDIISFAKNKATEFRTRAQETNAASLRQILFLLIMCIASGAAAAFLVTRSVSRSIRRLSETVQGLTEGSREKIRAAQAIGSGDLEHDLVASEPLVIDTATLPDDELGLLMKAAVDLSQLQAALDDAFRQMTAALRSARDEERIRDWLKTGQNDLGTLLRGEQKTDELADRVLAYLAERLGAGVGAFYLFDEQEQTLLIAASYAFNRRKHLSDRIPIGEGLAGQAAREKKLICLSGAPADYLPISSALGEAAPANIVALPLVHDGRLIGVLELGAFKKFSDTELDFLQGAVENLAIGIGVNLSRQRVNELLAQTQAQTEELRTQQEELQQNNEELEERSQMLENQREQIQAKNMELEVSGRQLEMKALELERASTYKSEFLANMSHEVRTPLNSLMILSRLLMENKEGNLNGRQVEFASTINKAGNELLNLINDILDLSKVEAGRLELHREEIPLTELCDPMESMFRPIAEHKGLAFDVAVEENVPPRLTVDAQRTQQVLRNLLANACKFTQAGSVRLRVHAPQGAANPLTGPAVAFSVEDTGIGVPADKHQLIFQAFQQADGATSRKYGGTGLGLSISLQLARLMGGDIRLESTEGKGSVFTLYLPVSAHTDRSAGSAAPRPQPSPAVSREPQGVPRRTGGIEPVAALPDDRERLQEGGRSILVIEDDVEFAKILMDMVRAKGFSCLVALEGESGIATAERYLPSAVILDVMLPGVDGWQVMQALKDSPRTRHIPVHFLTCLDDRRRAMAMGAIGLATKPTSPEQLDDMLETIEGAVNHKVKRLLIVEDNEGEAKSIEALLDGQDMVIRLAATGREAIELLDKEPFDCLVLDLGLADMSGFELLDHIQLMEERRRIPVIIHSGRELSREEETKLRHYTESIIVKGTKSPERLLAEVSLFLHRLETSLPTEQQRMIRTVLDREALLSGRKVLIVDDDMRNVFSLSAVLAERQVTVIEAENGQEALARLDEHPDTSIVLMDIMMPGMDGYEAIRQIRRRPDGQRLPIIAMTAKALKGDREECLKAGASDYIAKPIDVDKLLSLLRVWLFQQ